MNYTIAETYELPSEGKIYSQPINPLIKLSSMTTQHELQRLNRTDRPLKTMADIIDDCMVDKCGISSYDMCISDYQFLLHKIRTVTYGPEYKCTTTCPLCGEQNNSVVNLDDIKVTKYSEELKKYLSFELPRTRDYVSLNIQTPRMLDNIQIRVKEKKKEMPTYNGDFEFLITLMFLIDTINGEKMNDFQLENYIKKLPLADSNYINNMSNEFVKSFGISNEVEVTCSLCGLSYKSPFRITSEFYRPSL